MQNALAALHDIDVAVVEYQTGEAIKMDTPVDILMAAVKAFAGAEYRHSISLKTREAQKSKAKRGHYVGGAKAFGYVTVKVDGHLEYRIEPEQAKVVRRVFERFADGDGVTRIARALNAENVPAPGKGGWTKRSVRWMLTNEIYSGVTVFGKTTTRDRGGKVGVGVKVDEAKWVRVEAEHLRIIDAKTWATVQARATESRETHLRGERGRLLGKPEGSGVKADHLLNGIAVCGTCGGRMTWESKGKGRAYYFCSKILRGLTCGNRGGVPAELLEESVRDALTATLNDNPQAVADVISENVARIVREHEIALAAWHAENVDPAGEVVRIEAEIARLVAALAAGTASASIVAAIATKEARVNELKMTTAPALPGWLTSERWKEYTALLQTFGIDEALTAGRPRLGRQILRRLGCDKITVTADNAGWKLSGAMDMAPILGRAIAGGSDVSDSEGGDFGTRRGLPLPPALGAGPGNPGRPSMTCSVHGP